jgi:glutathione reductase (NADPH)
LVVERAYDLIVLGSGTAGQIPAYGCAEEGWSVAVIDPRPPGGTCANRGCDAKKPYTNAAEICTAAHALAGKGLTPQPAIDWPAVKRFKAGFTDPIPGRTERDLREAGIDFYNRSPRFVDEQTLVLDDGTSLRGKHFVIATGLKPRPLPIQGAQLLTTSDQFLQLQTLPRRVLFVGGGYISMEFAHAALRAGCAVTVLEKFGCPLNHADHDLAMAAGEASRDAGIAIHCNACVECIERRGEFFRVTCSDPDVSFEADLVVHGAGRVPNLDTLDLDAAHVASTGKGVTVSAHLQSTTNPRVYAAGDVSNSPGLELTPISGAEGKLVRDNLLRGNTRTVEQALGPATATVVFMIPPLAEVGLTEHQAREQVDAQDLAIAKGNASSWKLFRAQGRDRAAYKTIVQRSTGRLLGAHLLMPGAEELINLFVLAMTSGLTVRELRQPFYAYPTLGSHLSSMLPELE